MIKQPIIHQNLTMTDCFDHFAKFVEHCSKTQLPHHARFELLHRRSGDNVISYENILIKRPMYRKDGRLSLLYPMIAKIEALTYSAALHADIVTRKGSNVGEELSREKEVYIADVPIALKSNYCLLSGLNDLGLISLGENPNDPGGYFIISGIEKYLPGEVSLSDINKLTEWCIYKLVADELSTN